jgi:hypothetical protein
MLHEIFEVQQPPEYVGENGLTGIWGWMECEPVLDPLDPLATYDEQTSIRRTWCSIAHDEVYESVLTHEGGFSAALMGQFEPLYTHLVLNLGELGVGNECFTYEEFVSAITAVMVDAFIVASRIYAEVVEHAENLELLMNMGMPLSDQEKKMVKAVRATRPKVV